MARDKPKFSLLVAIRYYGWGGLGKLRLILDELPHADVTLYGNARITSLTKDFLASHHRFSKGAPERSDVALAINDTFAANRIADLGVPVVYVDSLPYVRKTDGELPALEKMAHYCGQKYPADVLPLPNPRLRAWPDIRWIDPIVPAARTRRGGRGIVVNIGGLHVYDVPGIDQEAANGAAEAYLKLVALPLARHLRESGRSVSAVCGNFSAAACTELRALLPECDAIGPQTPYAFERTLQGADLLITSPGSTTMLQAIAMGLPTLLLPPQIISQVLNARVFAKPQADTMQWPASVLDLEELDRVHARGLGAMANYFYRSIADAEARSSAGTIAAIIRKGVDNAPSGGVLNPDVSRLGFSGASQVARLLEQTRRPSPGS
jgi:hydroxymethylcytosylglucuronate/cytosylglucuronate synthase